MAFSTVHVRNISVILVAISCVYARNFYAKDADELNIMLPEKDGKPDYSTMEIFISAVQKLVIKDVVLYADQKIAATKEAVKK